MTDEQKRLIAELSKQGKSDPKIAKLIGISRSVIGKYRRSVDIKPAVTRGAKTKLSDAEQARRMMLYKKGLSDAALAVALNLTKPAVSDWRKRNKLPANVGQHKANRPMPKPYSYKPAPKGASCGTCKFWEPSEPESRRCKTCDHREMWEAV